MSGHATWADSLVWSHSPMRKEAGLSYPAIECFAERPAKGGKKRTVETGLLEFKMIPSCLSLLLPPPCGRGRCKKASSYVIKV